MRAGTLRYKLQILKPTRVTDRMGAERTEYEPTAVIWAERVRQDGSMSDEVGEHFAASVATFNVRDAHEVDENWRVQQLGGYLYTVVAIIPNIDRGYKALKCERVNE